MSSPASGDVRAAPGAKGWAQRPVQNLFIQRKSRQQAEPGMGLCVGGQRGSSRAPGHCPAAARPHLSCIPAASVHPSNHDLGVGVNPAFLHMVQSC